MNYRTKPAAALCALIILFSCFTLAPAAAQVTLTEEAPAHTFGGKQCEGFAVSFSQNVTGIYIEFADTAADFTVTANGETTAYEGKFINRYIDVSDLGTGEISVAFPAGASLYRASCYTADPPADVQIWEDMCEEADLLICTTHSDDEQLFFAGIMPHYSAMGYEIQVVYFTDHNNYPPRRRELLAGLWECGIRHYPYINYAFSDAYSESVEGALYNLKALDGRNYDDAVAFQVEMIRRFKPLVIAGHDINGEYGHGQHKLNSKSLCEAVELAGNALIHPESAEKYGVWTPKKLYLHLYGKNQITLDFLDVPMDRLGGLTPFQVTQKGFSHHASQHWTWFKTWIYGNSGEIVKAAQITKYSPMKWGLYFSTVGEDTVKNGFFENVYETHAQKRQRLIFENPIPGDVNLDGAVTREDCLLFLPAYYGEVLLNSARFKRADANGDGVLNAIDNAIIKRAVFRAREGK
ncbi:MAG: PIG-L family deacetylase [Clostridia bacterium]|nr:PIG-L family deacetylase [Clostridia bacterium]